MAYVLEIKPSARKRNAAAGRAVNRDGTRWSFATRKAAERWAEELTQAGGELVWVQSAHPRDGSGVDGYLLSRLDRGSIADRTRLTTEGTGRKADRKKRPTEQDEFPLGERR
ncbi:Uncharacterized protein AArcCO_0982 [Halalkaliarchaeum sp. AArc-CO]|uniref:hypothetical protein n=1 Tax=unclassified Halalkaliarchaeum TaxID=2678344 RepID=UPI00217D2AE5|nr:MULTISPECIES: hypothetical protein [unclassified Halalkaliarchaeum]MDR5672956.1 hypothetical protein [Halalkaliarchaeum sp. AArc-GB]UWG50299.1 Uncharacterized protein AArcCO_0982 [Halalkaliarchaeum sp. AArc-CO]